jgi:hypothetical protein
MLKWCFKRNQKNFTILIGILRLLTWALPFAQWKIAAAAAISAWHCWQCLQYSGVTCATQLKYGTLPFKYFQGYNQFFRVPGSAEIIIYCPNAVVIFQQLGLAGQPCQVHPCLGGAAWRIALPEPSQESKRY